MSRPLPTFMLEELIAAIAEGHDWEPEHMDYALRAARELQELRASPSPELGAPIASFSVAGLAETKGSWRAVPGKGKRSRFIADNPREAAWSQIVGWSAKLAMRKRAATAFSCGSNPSTAIVGVRLDFVLPFPKGNTHHRDADKLARSVLDALQGIVYVNDRQVDYLHVTKRCTDKAKDLGAAIVVAPLLAHRPETP